jgi:uncharacterized cofD-like protein
LLASLRERLGSLQAATDWAADLLGARGRVLPAAEVPCVLVVCDAAGRVLSGESHIEAHADAPIVASVQGAPATNPEAIAAIEGADVLFIGPGSFFTSTLAVVSMEGVARACVESSARCIYVANIAEEGKQTAGWPLQSYARILRDHLTIASLGGEVHMEVLAHDPSGFSESSLEDGTRVHAAPVALAEMREHHPDLLAAALSHYFGFERRATVGDVFESTPSTRFAFADELEKALALLGSVA